MTDRDILLSLIASLTLADHMGDASNDIWAALRLMNMPAEVLEAEDLHDLGTALGKLGVKTLYGTSLLDD